MARCTPRPKWTVYAWSARPIAVQRTRHGIIERSYWLRRFYNLDAALEQAQWCMDAWPDARCTVDMRDRSRLLIVARLFEHDEPRLPCGCARSLPPCSLEHAVRVGA